MARCWSLPATAALHGGNGAAQHSLCSTVCHSLSDQLACFVCLQFLGINGYAELYDKSNKIEHSWMPRWAPQHTN